MAAIIRVKRRIDEEPLNAFVLDCKKRKCDDEAGTNASASSSSATASNEETSTTIVKFAGTVANQHDITTHLNKLTKADAIIAANRVRPPTNITSRNREELRHQTQDSRFKIVNCYRTVDGGESVATSSSNTSSVANGNGQANSTAQNITIVDIERHSTDDTAVPSTAPVSSGAGQLLAPAVDDTHSYVYDLYLPDASHNTDHDYALVDNLLSVRPFDDLTYGNARENGRRESSDESEDSNDENNWRNEYPDTEEDVGDDDSVNEADMRRAFQSMDMDEDRQLSSDDDQTAYKNGFIYSVDAESIGFEDNIDYGDVNRYGEAYARYKARVLKKKDSDDDDEYDQELSDNYQSD